MLHGHLGLSSCWSINPAIMTPTNPFWSFATPFADNNRPTFSERLSHSGDHIRIPSREHVQSDTQRRPDPDWSQASFQEVPFAYDMSKGEKTNVLTDLSSTQSGNWPLTERFYSLSAGEQDLRCPQWTLWKTILLPTATIILPMAFLVAGLLALIFGYRVRSEDSLFAEVSNSDALSNHAVVLVNYSATRIVFVASWASTLAPLLASFVMNLSSFHSALLMYHSSLGTDQHDLPTPYQYSLLVGLCLASIGRLRRYFSYSKEEAVVVPPVLRRAARSLAMTLLLACVVFGADTALHYTTSTINFDQVSHSPETHAYGRGLSQECLALNRSDNFGLPCSRNGVVSALDYDAYVASQNEIFFLQHGTSNKSEIRLVPVPDKPNEKVALLIPQPTHLSPFRDFGASTAGVITTCEPITSSCNWTTSGPSSLFSQFNCSDVFWGVLGQSANVSDIGTVISDADVPPLGFKPGAALQYSFFTDASLNTPYDSSGNEGPFMPDSDLINPVYLGIAARFASTSQRAGVNMSSDPGVHQGPTSNLDFVLRCKYTTYLADYNWVNSTARVNTLTPSPNGTIAEIFHGYNLVGSFSAFDNNLQDFILQAALEPNSEKLAESFANAYSTRIMSVIGPFLSPRQNAQEQVRSPLLVAKVPKIPLAVLVAGCCSYVLFGVGSAVVAYRALKSVDVRDLAYRFSLPALALAAFRDEGTDRAVVDRDGHGVEKGRRQARGRGPGHGVFDETKVRAETMRVAVEGTPKMGFVLKSLV